MEDKHLIKSHNKNLLLYHFVCHAKYRRKVFTKEVEKTLKGISKVTKRIPFKLIVTNKVDLKAVVVDLAG